MSMLSKYLIFSLLFLLQPSLPLDKEMMVSKVNEVRVNGCKCGRTNMPPVGKLKWNDKLFLSAESHASDMRKNRYFSHTSRRGEDVGERVDKFNYDWQVVGENIAEGQRNFDEALEDWIKSPSHCRMIMDPKVDEIGIARAGNYWVQHFGKQKRK